MNPVTFDVVLFTDPKSCEAVQIQNGVIWIGNGSQCLMVNENLSYSGDQVVKFGQSCINLPHYLSGIASGVFLLFLF